MMQWSLLWNYISKYLWQINEINLWSGIQFPNFNIGSVFRAVLGHLVLFPSNKMSILRRELHQHGSGTGNRRDHSVLLKCTVSRTLKQPGHLPWSASRHCSQTPVGMGQKVVAKVLRDVIAEVDKKRSYISSTVRHLWTVVSKQNGLYDKWKFYFWADKVKKTELERARITAPVRTKLNRLIHACARKVRVFLRQVNRTLYSAPSNSSEKKTVLWRLAWHASSDFYILNK